MIKRLGFFIILFSISQSCIPLKKEKIKILYSRSDEERRDKGVPIISSVNYEEDRFVIKGENLRGVKSVKIQGQNINHNLSVANASIIDRIEMPETFIFLHLYRLIKSYFTINEWFLFGSMLLMFQAIWFLGLRFGILKGKVPKMISFSLIFIVIITHVIAIDSYSQNKGVIQRSS